MDLGLQDATAVVVGGGRGMGFAAARCLADDGARVALVGRTKDVLERAARDLTDRGSPDALGLVADTTDAEAVQRVFDELSDRWDGELNALINAVGPGTQGTFEDLTSSVAAARYGRLDLDDLNNANNFSPNKAYGDSKLANILFTKGLHKRFHAQGLSAVAFHPGNVATNFASETSSYFRFVYHTPLWLALISPERGARPLVQLAEGTAGQDWRSGAYYNRHKLGKTNPQADDEHLADQLWQRREEMVGL